LEGPDGARRAAEGQCPDRRDDHAAGWFSGCAGRISRRRSAARAPGTDPAKAGRPRAGATFKNGKLVERPDDLTDNQEAACNFSSTGLESCSGMDLLLFYWL
jgi:hypothetical protein